MKRIAVDIGGTFTDIVCMDEDTAAVVTDKVRSTPEEIGRAVFEAIQKIRVDLREIGLFVHGTTVGLNAVVQQKGAKLGLLTTDGFTDVLEMGRGDRKDLYSYTWKKPKPLVPRHLRLGLRERTDFLGNVTAEVDRREVEERVRQLRESGAEAVAVCLLHSYANPANELRVGEIVKEVWPEADVSLSHQVAREIREFERTSTTVLDAYIKRIVITYLIALLSRLEQDGFAGQLLIVSPNGVLGVKAIEERTIATFASGPIGGVSGATLIAGAAGIADLVTMDVGGTSFDVSVIKAGEALVRHQTELMGYPVLMPGMDIRPIGAGGGSIARVDSGGLLTVGPDSAGASPGPMCYGLGGIQPTVTDAAVVNGVIDPDYFLGGEIKLDAALARKGVGEIAARLGVSLHEAAGGILTVARNGMTTATKEVLIGQGYDPRDFTLFSYGGGGGLFAAGLARDLSMARVLVPPNPGVFSAWGMLTMDIAHTFAHTFVRPMATANMAELAGIYWEMETRAGTMLAEERVAAGDVQLQRSLDMCYEGQGHYVEVPVPAVHLDEDAKPAIVEAFHRLHEIRYGHRMAAPPRIVNVRMKAVGKLRKVPLKRTFASAGRSTAPVKGTREVFMDGKLRPCNVYNRADLVGGNVVPGPAIVEEPHTITVVLPGQRVGVDALENLVIEA